MDSGIQDFVAGQAGVGQRDSEGEFTINQTKAWEKLGALALPNEMAWIAKIVQSAMAARVALAVQQSRDETIFTWGSGVDWSHAQLEGAVFGSGPVPIEDWPTWPSRSGLWPVTKATLSFR